MRAARSTSPSDSSSWSVARPATTPRSFGANVDPWLSACSIESKTASNTSGVNSVAPIGT